MASESQMALNGYTGKTEHFLFSLAGDSPRTVKMEILKVPVPQWHQLQGDVQILVISPVFLPGFFSQKVRWCCAMVE